MTKLADTTTAKATGWPGDGATLLEELVSFVRRYVVMTEAQATAVALFVIHTHAAAAADTTPYLAVTSAEKRSGKSRVLEVLALLVAQPLRAGGVTEAALFRSISEREPCLLMDEVDAIFGPKARDHEDLRALLNAGYRRGTPVLRCVGEGSKQKVEAFEVFSPKVLAGIGRLPDTIADRSLLIRLKRRARGEQVEKFRERIVTTQAEPLRARLEAWVELHDETLARAEPDLPDELDDRAQDALEPLLAIADAAGSDWPQRGRSALVELRAGADDDEDGDSAGIRLLVDVRRIYAGRGVDRMTSKELLAELLEDAEAPWADWRGGNGLTQRSLANLLRGFGIRSKTIRFADETTAKGYMAAAFEDAFTRYLPGNATPSVTAVTTAQPCGIEAISYPSQDESCYGWKNGANPHGYVDVTDVTDRNAKTGPDGHPDTDPDAELERLRSKFGDAFSDAERTS